MLSIVYGLHCELLKTESVEKMIHGLSDILLILLRSEVVLSLKILQHFGQWTNNDRMECILGIHQEMSNLDIGMPFRTLVALEISRCSENVIAICDRVTVRGPYFTFLMYLPFFNGIFLDLLGPYAHGERIYLSTKVAHAQISY